MRYRRTGLGRLRRTIGGFTDDLSQALSGRSGRRRIFRIQRSSDECVDDAHAGPTRKIRNHRAGRLAMRPRSPCQPPWSLRAKSWTRPLCAWLAHGAKWSLCEKPSSKEGLRSRLPPHTARLLRPKLTSTTTPLSRAASLGESLRGLPIMSPLRDWRAAAL